MHASLKDWPLVPHVAELTRTVPPRKTGTISQEGLSLLTALTPCEASPSRLLELIRGQWSIENSSHDVRDVTFQEERSRLPTGNAPQIRATFHNLAITLIHRTGSSQIAASRRHVASHPRHAFDFLLPKGSSQQSFTSPSTTAPHSSYDGSRGSFTSSTL